MKTLTTVSTLAVLALAAGCTSTPAPSPTQGGVKPTPIVSVVTPDAQTPAASVTPAPAATSTTVVSASESTRTPATSPVPQAPVKPTTTAVKPSTASTKPTATTTAAAAWSPSCSSAEGDARKLLAAIAATSATTPAAVKASTDRLMSCPAAHVLAVSKQVGTAPATQVVRDQIAAGLRAKKLTLSGSKVGFFVLGEGRLEDAKPVLEAVLGKPDKVATYSCELSGATAQQWRWKGFEVSFDTKAKGTPISSWRVTNSLGRPANLELAGDLPWSATLDQLHRYNAQAKQSAVFGNDTAPWMAEVKPGLTYLWNESAKTASTGVVGGPLQTCD